MIKMRFIKSILLFLYEVKARQEKREKEKQLEYEKRNEDFEEMFYL